jgi:hypothetical protein
MAAAIMKIVKLSLYRAKPARRQANAEHNEAIENPRRRPTLRMMIVAGMVVAATQITMIEMGNVASEGLLLSFAPIMPPSVTMMIAPVAEISWHKIKMQILRFGIAGKSMGREVAHSHIFNGACMFVSATAVQHKPL